MDLKADLDPKEFYYYQFFMSDNHYCKCPKISYTKVSDKMAYANSIALSILRNNCTKGKN